jgi:hypothetical protein
MVVVKRTRAEVLVVGVNLRVERLLKKGRRTR